MGPLPALSLETCASTPVQMAARRRALRRNADEVNATTAKAAGMGNTMLPLSTAAERVVKENAGTPAASILRELKFGHPVAVVTLLHNGQFTTRSEKLD